MYSKYIWILLVLSRVLFYHYHRHHFIVINIASLKSSSISWFSNSFPSLLSFSILNNPYFFPMVVYFSFGFCRRIDIRWSTRSVFRTSVRTRRHRLRRPWVVTDAQEEKDPCILLTLRSKEVLIHTGLRSVPHTDLHYLRWRVEPGI